MSVTSCLLLFLLCISMHACNARGRHLIRAVDKKLEKKRHFSFRNDEKTGSDEISAVSKVKPSSSKQHEMGRRESIAGILSSENTPKQNETRTGLQLIPKVEGKTSGAVQTESLESVSWHVPHKKRSGKDPGFNLDYSPPKTHPPSHN